MLLSFPAVRAIHDAPAIPDAPGQHPRNCRCREAEATSLHVHDLPFPAIPVTKESQFVLRDAEPTPSLPNSRCTFHLLPSRISPMIYVCREPQLLMPQLRYLFLTRTPPPVSPLPLYLTPLLAGQIRAGLWHGSFNISLAFAWPAKLPHGPPGFRWRCPFGAARLCPEHPIARDGQYGLQISFPASVYFRSRPRRRIDQR